MLFRLVLSVFSGFLWWDSSLGFVSSKDLRTAAFSKNRAMCPRFYLGYLWVKLGSNFKLYGILSLDVWAEPETSALLLIALSPRVGPYLPAYLRSTVDYVSKEERGPLRRELLPVRSPDLLWRIRLCHVGTVYSTLGPEILKRTLTLIDDKTESDSLRTSIPFINWKVNMRPLFIFQCRCFY